MGIEAVQRHRAGIDQVVQGKFKGARQQLLGQHHRQEAGLVGNGAVAGHGHPQHKATHSPCKPHAATIGWGHYPTSEQSTVTVVPCLRSTCCSTALAA
jgi:hypothetical protein